MRQVLQTVTIRNLPANYLNNRWNLPGRPNKVYKEFAGIYWYLFQKKQLFSLFSILPYSTIQVRNSDDKCMKRQHPEPQSQIFEFALSPVFYPSALPVCWGPMKLDRTSENSRKRTSEVHWKLEACSLPIRPLTASRLAKNSCKHRKFPEIYEKGGRSSVSGRQTSREDPSEHSIKQTPAIYGHAAYFPALLYLYGCADWLLFAEDRFIERQNPHCSSLLIRYFIVKIHWNLSGPNYPEQWKTYISFVKKLPETHLIFSEICLRTAGMIVLNLPDRPQRACSRGSKSAHTCRTVCSRTQDAGCTGVKYRILRVKGPLRYQYLSPVPEIRNNFRSSRRTVFGCAKEAENQPGNFTNLWERRWFSGAQLKLSAAWTTVCTNALRTSQPYHLAKTTEIPFCTPAASFDPETRIHPEYAGVKYRTFMGMCQVFIGKGIFAESWALESYKFGHLRTFLLHKLWDCQQKFYTYLSWLKTCMQYKYLSSVFEIQYGNEIIFSDEHKI